MLKKNLRTANLKVNRLAKSQTKL
jgi:hypothetical protein